MNKFLYIDGENVNKFAVTETTNKIKESLQNGDHFVGRLYGSREAVKSLITPCLLRGIIFVETSVLSVSKKNVADMKLIVDCMYDVSTYHEKQEPCEVYLLTKDTDFFPLVFKLIEMGVCVKSPLLDLTEENLDKATKENLDMYLKSRGFYSNKNLNYLDNIFSAIKSFTGDEFSDEIIETHLEIHTKKFFKWVDGKFGIENSLSTFYKSLREFSFIDLIRKLGVTDRALIDDVYLNYTQKIFGFIPKVKTTPSNYLRLLSAA